MRTTAGLVLLLFAASSQSVEVWLLADVSAISPADWVPDPPPVVEIIEDFDGDGTLDSLRVLSLIGSDRHVLVASLNEGTSAFKVIHFGFDMKRVGLRPVPPGVYRTLCGKGYDHCGNGVATARKLTRPGFELVYWEKASSLFYWDDAESGFVSFSTSD